MAATTGTTVLLLVVALVLVAAALIWVALWILRSTRTDPDALGPLEVMGDRAWRQGDPDQRQSVLTGARPPDAFPPAPILPFDEEEPEGEVPAVAPDVDDAPDLVTATTTDDVVVASTNGEPPSDDPVEETEARPEEEAEAPTEEKTEAPAEEETGTAGTEAEVEADGEGDVPVEHVEAPDDEEHG